MGKEEDSGPRTEAQGVPLLLVQEKGPLVETKKSRRHGTPERSLLLCVSPSPEPSTAAPLAVLILISKLLHSLNSPESVHRSELLLPHARLLQPPAGPRPLLQRCPASSRLEARATHLHCLSVLLSDTPFSSPPRCCHPVR